MPSTHEVQDSDPKSGREKVKKRMMYFLKMQYNVSLFDRNHGKNCLKWQNSSTSKIEASPPSSSSMIATPCTMALGLIFNIAQKRKKEKELF